MVRGSLLHFLAIQVLSITAIDPYETELYEEKLPPLVVGDVITVHGKVLPAAMKLRTSLNIYFCSDTKCTISFLRLNFDLFDVMLSSYSRDPNVAEDHAFVKLVLRRENEFLLKITADKEEFRIKLDDKDEIKSFKHRASLSEFRFIKIGRNGDSPGIVLFDVEWDEYSSYNHSINELKLGDEIRIRGKALNEYYKFAVSLCTDETCAERDLRMEIDTNVTTLSSIRNNKSLNEQRYPSDYIKIDNEFTITMTIEADHIRIESNNMEKTHPHIVQYNQTRYMEVRCERSLLQRQRFQLLSVEWISRTTTTPIPSTVAATSEAPRSDQSLLDNSPTDDNDESPVAEHSESTNSPSERSTLSAFLLCTIITMCPYSTLFN